MVIYRYIKYLMLFICIHGGYIISSASQYFSKELGDIKRKTRKVSNIVQNEVKRTSKKIDRDIKKVSEAIEGEIKNVSKPVKSKLKEGVFHAIDWCKKNPLQVIIAPLVLLSQLAFVIEVKNEVGVFGEVSIASGQDIFDKFVRNIMQDYGLHGSIGYYIVLSVIGCILLSVFTFFGFIMYKMGKRSVGKQALLIDQSNQLLNKVDEVSIKIDQIIEQIKEKDKKESI